MNDQPIHADDAIDPVLEQRLTDAGRVLSYPPTPDIAGAVRAQIAQPRRSHLSRRLLWAALIIALLLTALMAVPEVRAAVLRFLRIGSVTIFQTEPTPTATPTGTFTPAPTATLIYSLQSLKGRMSLDEARKQFGYPIRLPTYPADLGLPDSVFLQYFGDNFVVLVWLDAPRKDVRLTLHILSPNAQVNKIQPKIIERTTVNGNEALWTQGPY